MSINPIELQVLIPKSTEVGKAQHVVNRQDALQQQHVAEQWKDISTNRQQQVQSTAKNEGGKVGREKQAKEQKHSQKERQHGDKHNNTDIDTKNRASKDDPVRGHLIDIKT
jgi:hypothetical protein